MKHLFFLCLLLLVGCATSSLEEKEKRLVGNWRSPDVDEQIKGMYMELHEDRTGVWGPAIKVKGEVGLLPYMSMLIENWRIKNDTLSVEMKMRPGYVVRGPDGKESKNGKTSSHKNYKIEAVTDSMIVLIDPEGEVPSIERMRSTEKLKLVSY
jgi:hypothetical protein